jgi:Tfp pilus assembly protein FimT
MELLTVVAVIAAMSLLVVPNLVSSLPRARLSSEAQRLATFMRQARLKALNTQKPVRVSINCIDHFAASDPSACRARMELAVFEDGEMSKWVLVRDGRLEFNGAVNIQARDSNWNPVNGSGLNSDLAWAVFFPSGRLATSFGPPFNLSLWSYGEEASEGWALTLNSASGRVSLTKRSTS